MTNDEIEALRAVIRGLYPKRAIGDLTEKVFQRELVNRSLDLYRALIRMKTKEDEQIVCEHHVVRSHFKVTQSVMREPEQETVSLFATDRSLFHLKAMLMPGRPPSADKEDNFSMEQIPLEHIGSVRVKRQIRIEEMGMGAAIAGLAALFYSSLAITGPFMVGLGILGILHGLLLPTRWVQVETLDPASEPILVYSLRKKSARRMVKFLREKMRRQ
ncbi:MAG: hypothetical protein C0403_04470 [Desulfobacterium sp.]|nr:hypothetical protein [Desulfobacterium sp.]